MTTTVLTIHDTSAQPPAVRSRKGSLSIEGSTNLVSVGAEPLNESFDMLPDWVVCKSTHDICITGCCATPGALLATPKRRVLVKNCCLPEPEGEKTKAKASLQPSNLRLPSSNIQLSVKQGQ